MKRFAFAAAALLFTAPFAQAAEITVSFSDEFQEELTDNYGTREGDYLARKTTEYLTRELASAGKDAERIDVVIEDATPNRPTFKQLGDTPGLDGFRSISTGGMAVSATAYDSAGNVVGTLSYDWFDTDIRNAMGSATWSDATRASQRFARKFAKAL